ncbi:MAG: exonuclease SbcCD subunit D C-terminal domain-containing protein [Synergistaceae bacterium]|jgi:exonuclease SbcD|nr:exonuclease SbcCD subunit D C-terminal domain-containing protein [Synergistaceae bacterium]
MKILHTSDWHLGRTLYGRKRTAEFEAFLEWLLAVLREQKIDVLLVAGDIFDTIAPPNRAQQLYYRFLCRASESGCRHAVIVGGNHDSPSFLDAPKELLSFLDVHVVGAVPEKIEEELLILRGSDGLPELLVCAVPYLRDKDVRIFSANESLDDKERSLTTGIEGHYGEIGRLAVERLAQLRDSGEVGANKHVPIVATGHLFAASGQTVEGDGVRDLYVGSLGCVDVKRFPPCFDYLALGHLHSPQKIGETARYSGSPLPMNAKEAEQGRKSVLVIDFDAIDFNAGAKIPETKIGDAQKPSITELAVPLFQELAIIEGDMEFLESRLVELRERESSAWLEIIYTGETFVPDLRERLRALTAGSGLEILRVKDARALKDVPGAWGVGEMLDELDVSDVFLRCLDVRKVPDEARAELLNAYREVLASLQEM